MNPHDDYVAKATRYAEQVVSGEISACSWVRFACQRQLDDLKRTDWQWTFDRRCANRVCEFIELLPHVKGRWKTKTISLEPWQCFVLTTIFGWVDSEGLRRFRKALIVIPRKNTKTTLAAAIALFLLAVDCEPGCEIYSAATTRDQAKYCWDIASKMVKKTPELTEEFGIEAMAHSIMIEQEGACFKPLSRDADTLEGLSPHGVIVDELHAHRTREVFDVLDEATGSRKQPLIFVISTEGDNSSGVFAEQVNYGQDVLNGSHEDDSYFALIYTIDVSDDWTAPSSWAKANPNLGVSIYLKDLETRFRQAEKNPQSQASFLTKRLNVRQGAVEGYFNMLAWEQRCKDTTLKLEDFYGKSCFMGIDLASKQDIAARMTIFPRGQTWSVFGRYYLPEDACERGHPKYDLYRGWANKGILTLTPGSIIDYEFIERDLLEDAVNFQVREVAIDPHNATQFNTRMAGQGLLMVDIPQNVLRLSEPMKTLGAKIVAGQIRHNGDPALTWMVGNVTAKIDANDNVFPRKARNENKIDAAVAMIMAASRAMVNSNVISIYEDMAAVI